MANKIPLGIIYSSPQFWKGKKISDFLVAANKHIQDTCDEFKEFKEDLDNKAKSPEWNLWNGKLNWCDVLGEEHFQLVTAFLEAGKKYDENKEPKNRKMEEWKKSSVIELLKTIRDKRQHNGNYLDAHKRKLGWFQLAKGKLQFDEDQYGKYWSEKFPRLTLFLWVHFYEFRDVPTLRDSYPLNVKLQDSDSNFLKIVACLTEALQDQLDEGAAISRYSRKIDQTSISLELRPFPYKPLAKLLDGSLILKSIICENHVCCHWINQKGNNASDFYSKLVLNTPVDNNCRICIAFAFVNTVKDLSKSPFDEIINCHCGTICRRIIIFSSTSEKFYRDCQSIYKFIKKFGQDFSENLVTLQDVTEPTRKNVETNGEVFIQGTKVKISSLFPENIDKTQYLNILSGNQLSRILKGKPTNLFEKIKLPEVCSVYIERGLQNLVVLESDILKLVSNENKFVCAGISKKYLMNMTSCNDTDIGEIEALSLGSRVSNKIVALRRYQENEINQIFKTNQNIHVLRHLQEQTFEWVETLGSTEILEQNCKTFKEHNTKRNETEFLENLEKSGNQEKILIIADKPGMGKSEVLASFASKLLKTFSSRLVIYLNVTEFAKELKKFGLLSECNLVLLFYHLTCNTDFECKLIHAWIVDKTNSQPRIELMLDALDETSIENKKIVIEAINILLNSFTTIRVWITSRNHVINELASKFGSYGYKLLPLSFSNQVGLVVSLWQKYLAKNASTSNISTEELNTFAAQCLHQQNFSKNTDIMGIPLLCRMIAEIYENEVIEQDFNLNADTSLSEIYISMFERKLEIYLKNKCGLSTLAMDHAVASTMRENLERWHFYFAIKLIFPEQVSANFTSLIQADPLFQNEIPDAVLQFGLIERIYPLTFVHRTFAEFLVSRFVFKIITRSNTFQFSDDILGNFLENQVFRFDFILYPVITANWQPGTLCAVDSKILFSHQGVNYFLNDLLETNREEDELYSKSIDLLWTIADCVVTDFYLAFMKFFQMLPSLSAILHSKSRSLFSYLLQNKQNEKGMLILGLLSDHFTEITEVINLGEYFQPQTWHELQSFHKNKFGIVHWSIISSFCQNGTSPQEDLVLIEFLKFIASKNLEVFEEKDENGVTPLLMLVQANYPYRPVNDPLIDFFVNELKVNVHQTTHDNNTIIHILSPITPDEIGETDIHFLKKYRYILLKILEDENNRYMLNVRNSSGHTPLLSLIHYFNEHRNFAVYYREKPDDTKGSYVLRVGHGYEEYCKAIRDVLLVFWKFGADFNVKFADGRTALHLAIDQWYNRLLICALAQFGNIYVKDNKGRCALHLAILRKNLFLFMWLVKEFVGDLYVCDFQGNSVLDLGVIHFIIRHGWEEYKNTVDESTMVQLKEVIEYIVEMYPNSLEMQDALGRTPLLLLLQKGPHITDIDLYQRFVIFLAFFVGPLKANVNAIDKDGNTVFHYQASHIFDTLSPELDLQTYLLAVQVWSYTIGLMLNETCLIKTLNQKNKKGKAPLSVIMETFFNHPMVVHKTLEIFSKVGADLGTTDSNGDTLLIQAIKKEHNIKVTQALIHEYKINTAAVNLSGECALSVAISKNNVEVTKLLLEHGQPSFIKTICTNKIEFTKFLLENRQLSIIIINSRKMLPCKEHQATVIDADHKTKRKDLL